MTNNMLCLGYEMLLQPDSALCHKHNSDTAAMDVEKFKVAVKKFFELDKLFHANQRTK